VSPEPLPRSTAASLATLAELRCRAHNRHDPEQDYGRDYIDRKIAAGRWLVPARDSG
jgi:hypothetical protein